MAKSNIPHNQEAEESVICAVLVKPDRIGTITADLSPGDFYSPNLGALWAAYQEMFDGYGEIPDALSLSNAAKRHGGTTSPQDLLDITANSPLPARSTVELILNAKSARDLLRQCADTLAGIQEGQDPFELSDTLSTFLGSMGGHSTEPEAITLQELAESAQASAPWVIDGLLKSDWHALVTAPEGAGKAVLLRTMCMSIAQGFHPFTHKRHPIHRTLLVDLENPTDAILETAIPLKCTLEARAGEFYDEDRFKIWYKRGGVNIRRRKDRADLQREIAAHKPSLVCIGPLYKLYTKKSNETYEGAAIEVINILDELRTKYNFALVLEHHAPKGAKDSRGLEPMGSQLWMAWPEMGIGLRPDKNNTDLHIEKWRGDRMKNNWPDRIERDRDWLISGAWD